MRSFAFLFVFKDEAEKLCKIIKKPEDISDKTLSLKSDILADKMSFCFTNLFFKSGNIDLKLQRMYFSSFYGSKVWHSNDKYRKII